MLTLNLIHLIKHKLIPIKYKIKNNILLYNNNYIIYNNLNKNILEIINLLNSLSITYLYIYKYMSLKQKILLSTDYIQHIFMLKTIAILTSNYYIYNNIYSGIFSNWIFLKKKLTIYKWLKYFFLTNLIIKNNYKNIFYIQHTLYLLYIKLKLKYNGLKNLDILPNTLIFINLDKNKYIEEILKLNKNIIIITNNKLNNFSSTNIIKIITTNKNYLIIHFILKIIATAIFHGLLY